MYIKEYGIQNRKESLVRSLAELWNGSVRTTHHFLSETDIHGLRPYVDEALRQVPVLGVAVGVADRTEGGNNTPEGEENIPVGFVGIAEGKIEMLFVAPEHIGKGVGKRLMQWAVGEKGATMIDVNEQNAHAAAVYRHRGFRVYSRSEYDDQGNPFPILRMRLE